MLHGECGTKVGPNSGFTIDVKYDGNWDIGMAITHSHRLYGYMFSSLLTIKNEWDQRLGPGAMVAACSLYIFFSWCPFERTSWWMCVMQHWIQTVSAYRCWGPLTQAFHELIIQFFQKYILVLCSIMMPQFCACHDSRAVAACANVWPDFIYKIWIVTRWISVRCRQWAPKRLMKRVPGYPCWHQYHSQPLSTGCHHRINRLL